MSLVVTSMPTTATVPVMTAIPAPIMSEPPVKKTRNRRKLTEVEKILRKHKFVPMSALISLARDDSFQCTTCLGEGTFTRVNLKRKEGDNREEEVHCHSCKGSGRERITAEIRSRAVIEIASYTNAKRGKEDGEGNATPDTAILVLKG